MTTTKAVTVTVTAPEVAQHTPNCGPVLSQLLAQRDQLVTERDRLVEALEALYRAGSMQRTISDSKVVGRAYSHARTVLNSLASVKGGK